MDADEKGKSLRCRLGRHRWVTRVNQGARWQECGGCGKFYNRAPSANRFPPAGTGGGAGGM